MNPGTEVAVIEPVRVDLGVIRADRPAQLLQVATEAANVLADLIESRKLYSLIQGKKFVKCEGWTTLAAMLGVTPHEIGVVEAPEGVFTATVELRRLTDGQPVSRASAECGAPDETDRSGKPLWASRARYARRSMALTRATAKACRLAFSWVMVLAGFQPTPSEEIPESEHGGSQTTVRAKAPTGSAVAGVQPAPMPPPPTESLDDFPRAFKEDEIPALPPANMPENWREEWPWGALKGRQLWTLSTDELHAQLGWAQKANRGKNLWPILEQILKSRGGA